MRDPANASSADRGLGCDGPPPPRRGAVVLLCLGIWLIHLAVQFDKPVHVDDTHYVAAARHLVTDPLRPFCNVINWKRTPDLAYRDNINPPLYVYLQAGWMALFGESIRGLHVLASLMVLLATVCGYRVARRFTRRPALATALFMLSPTLLPVTNLMVDVPVLAVGLLAVAVFIGAVDAARPGRAALAGLLVGAAILTKYNAIVLLPVLGLYALLHGRVRYAATLAIPVAMLGLWALHNYFFYENHEIHFLLTARYREYGKAWAENVFSSGVVFGASFLFLPVLYLWRLAAASWIRLIPAVFLGLLMFLGPTRLKWWGPIETVHRFEYWVFAANLLLLVALAAGRFARGSRTAPAPGRHGPARNDAASHADDWRDGLFLWGWAVTVVVAQVVMAYHQSPRYHFLAFPPFAMLLVQALERAAPGGGRAPAVLAWSSVALQLTLGLLIAASDHVHAAANRDFPARVRARYGERARIFCVGHWGLQYYCEKEGIPCFDAVNVDIRPGDLFILPQLQSRENLTTLFYRRIGLRWDLNTDLFEFADPDQPFTVFPNPWRMSLMEVGHTFLYATLLPAVPYSPRVLFDFAERFLVLRARRGFSTVGTDRSSRVRGPPGVPD